MDSHSNWERSKEQCANSIHPRFAKSIGVSYHILTVIIIQKYVMGDSTISGTPQFKKAFPFQDDVFSLPVVDLDSASSWYCKAFGMVEVERRDTPSPTVVLERDGTRIGFSINGGDATQDGAAILVSGISLLKDELEANGVEIGNWRVDEREGKKLQVFFVVAPDGLCYYFHEPI